MMANEENTISVSRGEEDKGKIPILDCKGKFDFSFFPDCIKGSKWVTGAADPVVESGDIKDYYINTTTGEVFQKTDKLPTGILPHKAFSGRKKGLNR